MFSGFDFKRFSLDALQDEENEGDATPLPVVTEHAARPEPVETPPPNKLPPANEEHSEWDWDQDNTAAPVERTAGVSKMGASEQRREQTQAQPAHSLEGERSAAMPTAGDSIAVASPAELGHIDGQGNPGACEPGDIGREGGAAEERTDVQAFQEASIKEEVSSNEMVREYSSLWHSYDSSCSRWTKKLHPSKVPDRLPMCGLRFATNFGNSMFCRLYRLNVKGSTGYQDLLHMHGHAEQNIHTGSRGKM